MKRLRFLVSGGTGFLGKSVIPKLKELGDVTCISRSSPDTINADLSFWNAKLDPKDLRGRFDVFLHMAGLYNLRINEMEGLKQNVMTTHTALTLAQKAEIPHFIHTSTIAVVVRHKMMMAQPDDLDTTVNYPDQYAYSKAFAEQMVRYWPDGLKSKLILRLGILVGDEANGKIHRIDGPYHAAESFGRVLPLVKQIPGALPLPGKKDKRLPLVPVNVVAEAIVNLCRISREENWEGTKSLHLSPKEGVSAQKLYSSILKFYGVDKSVRLMEKAPTAMVKEVMEALFQLPKEELEYLLSMPSLDTSETRRILGENWCPEFDHYEKAFWKGYREYISNR